MNQIKKEKREVKEAFIRELFMKYVMYWPLLLFLLILASTGSYVWLKYATPKYEATATILIKDEKKGADDSKLMESLNITETKKIIENEIEVLQSRTLIDKVVKSLHLYAPVYIEKEGRDISAYNYFPYRIEHSNPDSIIHSEKIYVKLNQKNGEVILNGEKIGFVNQWIDSKYGKIKFVSKNVSQTVSFQEPVYFILKKPRVITREILANLNIKTLNKLSSILNIRYRDEISQRAEIIVDKLIDMYNQTVMDDKNTLAENTLKFVDERLNAVSKDIDSIEKLVQSYKTSSGSSDISSQGQLYLKNVSENDQELGRLNMQLGVLDQLQYSIQSNSSGGLMPATVGISDPNISKLMTDLSDKELEYERLKKTVAENNPMLSSLKDQINRIRPSIIDNLNNQRQNLQASKSRLYATNARYNSILSSIPKKERDILQISRDQNVKNGIYSFLLQKREETKLSSLSNISNIKIINNALSSPYPVFPNKIIFYSVALVIAVFIFIVLITTREYINRKILYRNDIEKFTDIPVIGEITNNKNSNELIQKGERSFLAEEFRKMNVAISFLNINKGKNTILITSGIPGEGKSFIAANLAISNSLTGKKVLLIDTDLHKPTIDKLFKLPSNHLGLSEYLMGLTEFEDIIQNPPDYPNISIITSGSIQDNASELLLNEKMKECVEYYSRIFDIIVLDSAPTVMVADAFMLSKLCQITLYVIRHNHTPRMLVKRLEKNIESNPLKNVRIIFNGIKTRGYFKNNYGYGYRFIYNRKHKEYYSKN